MSQTLLNKMRELSIKEIKSRREELFQKTRNIIDKKQQSQYQNNQESCVESQGNNQVTKYEKIQEEGQAESKRKAKKKQKFNKFKSYWKKLLQISDWMIEIPENLGEYYVASRPQGNKSLIIFNDFKMQIRNKSGNVITEFQYPNKMYDGTIFQGYINIQLNRLIISDLIVWKNYPLTSNQFQFRLAWIMSNLNLNSVRQSCKVDIYMMKYSCCTVQMLKETYQQVLPYHKEGLIFTHKDSPYMHGLNPLSLIWKDLYISKYLINQIAQNQSSSKGIAYLTKPGQVKSLQGIILFKVNRQQLDGSHRYIRFGYKQVFIENVEDDNVVIRFDWINVLQTFEKFNNCVDSVSKLLYKSKVSHHGITIQQMLVNLLM